MKIICALISAVLLFVAAEVSLQRHLGVVSKMAAANPEQLGKQHWQVGVTTTETTSVDLHGARTTHGNPYKTPEDAYARAQKEVAEAQQIMLQKSELQKNGLFMALKLGCAGFVAWFLAYGIICVTTKPLDTILDSAFGNFIRYYVSPTILTVFSGGIVGFVWSFRIVTGSFF